MCNCKSYNMGYGEKPNVILELPNHLATWKQNRTVCIDACISEVIQFLWNNNIETLSCCCGHSRKNPEIVISDGYDDSEIKEIIELIGEIDNRNWDIFQWRLTKVN